MLSGCPQTSSENVPGGTPETPPRERPAAPGKGPEKDHFEQQVNNGRAVGDSSRKWRVETIHTHSPISLTLPLSSPKGDGFATPEMSATEAQLGLEFEVELRCTEVPRSRVRA